MTYDLGPIQISIMDLLRSQGPMAATAIRDALGLPDSPLGSLRSLRQRGMVSYHYERIPVGNGYRSLSVWEAVA